MMRYLTRQEHAPALDFLADAGMDLLVKVEGCATDFLNVLSETSHKIMFLTGCRGTSKD